MAMELATTGTASAQTARGVVIGGDVRFHRILPAGKEVTIELPAPGTDEITGMLEVWPSGGNGCGTRPYEDKQYHVLGLAITGTGDARILTAVVPPLQIQRSYCMTFRIERALREDQISAAAEAVGEQAAGKFDWAFRCLEPGIEAAVTKMVEDELTIRLGLLLADVPTIAAGAAQVVAPRASDVQRAAQLVVSLANVRKRCEEVTSNSQALSSKLRGLVAADEAVQDATDTIKRLAGVPRQIRAWPAAIREVAAPYTAIPLIAALNDPPDVLARIATNLRTVDPSLADDVLALTTLSGAPLANAVKALQDRLKGTPQAARELALFVPSRGGFVAVSLFSDPRVYADVLRDIVTTTLLDTQLHLIKSNGPQNDLIADRWSAAIKAVREANVTAAPIRNAVRELENARDDLVVRIRASLVDAVKKESVRKALRDTSTSTSAPTTGKPTGTDENASWVSPTVGVAIAFPWVRDASKPGFTDPWLVPYLGANIYFRRVDRVIDPSELVGRSSFWQKNSLTIGVWLQKPSLGGTAISGLWESGPVPFVGVGHRFTPYIRLDGGAAFYEHARRLPTLSDKAFGFAIWVGASIDADLWAAASGKLGR